MQFKRSKEDKVKVKVKGQVELNNLVCQNKDIDASDLDGEKVMMNLDKGQYFMMNEVASRIWDIIENEVAVSSVVDTLLEEYDVEKNDCEETVLDFLTKMKKAELITVA